MPTHRGPESAAPAREPHGNADSASRVEQLAAIDDVLGGLREARDPGATGAAEKPANAGGGKQAPSPTAPESPDIESASSEEIAFSAQGSSQAATPPATETVDISAEQDGEDTPPDTGPLDAMLLLRQVAAMDREADPGLAEEPADQPLPEVPPYELRGVLGRGGFSIVYEAVDPRISRRLALKLIRPEVMLMPGMRRRFLREAEIAARLRHPHLVVVFDVGSADGRLFIAEEFCEGGSLADWLERTPGPVPAKDAATFMAEVADAIAAANREGVLHRDLKPANILLVPESRARSLTEDTAGTTADRTYAHPLDAPAEAAPSLLAWQPKVADFGLAALKTDDSGARLTQLTATGIRLGTPAWMAPEQIDPSFGAVCEATDVHGLGRILERLLTGKPAHHGESDMESFRRILLADPVPVDEVVPGTSPDLAAVCLKCLEKQPANRYASAADLAAELRRFLAGRPTLARPLSWQALMQRQLTGSPWPGIAAAALAVGLIVTALLSWQQQRRERELDRQAAITRRNDAAVELLRGFGGWDSGDVPMALAAFARSTQLAPELSDTLAAKWLATRLHDEDDVLFRMPDDAAIYAMAVSPDASLAAAAGADGTLAIIPLSDDAEAETAPVVINVGDEINGLVFLSDDAAIAVVGQRGSLSLWNVATGESIARSDWGTALFGLACAPDGQLLAFGGEDRLLRIVSQAAPESPINTIDLSTITLGEKNNPDIEAICFVGPRTLALTLGNRILSLDVDSGEVLTSAEAGNQNVVHDGLASSPTAGLLCVTGGSLSIPFLFTEPELESAGQLPPHTGWVRSCSFSPDGQQIATACRDGVIRVFDIERRQETSRLIGHIGQVWQVAFAGSDTLISAGDDGSVRRWSPQPNPSRAPRGLSIARPDGERLATGDADSRILAAVVCRPPGSGPRLATVRSTGQLQLFDPESRQFEGPASVVASADFIRNNPPALLGLAASPSGHRLLFSPLDGKPLSVIECLGEGGFSITPLLGPQLPQINFCWIADDQSVVEDAEQLVLVGVPADQSTGFQPPVLLAEHDHPNGSQAVAASPQLPPQVVASSPQRLTLFTLGPDGTRLAPDRELPLLADDVVEAVWSPDGSRLACGTQSGTVAMYEITAGGSAPPKIISSHRQKIRQLAFDESGQTLISVDAESLRIHDAFAGVTYDEFTPGFEITAAAITPGDRSIILGTSEGVATIPLASREQVQADLSQQPGN